MEYASSSPLHREELSSVPNIVPAPQRSFSLLLPALQDGESRAVSSAERSLSKRATARAYFALVSAGTSGRDAFRIKSVPFARTSFVPVSRARRHALTPALTSSEERRGVIRIVLSAEKRFDRTPSRAFASVQDRVRRRRITEIETHPGDRMDRERKPRTGTPKSKPTADGCLNTATSWSRSWGAL